jgi:HD-GYP domain-containing protein (c-di-GMP phosphodiesterase class II)
MSDDRLSRLIEASRMLARERDINALCELILSIAKEATQADGGTLYLIDETTAALKLQLVSNETLRLRAGFRGGPPVEWTAPPLRLPDGSRNLASMATHCAWSSQTVLVDDAYAEEGAAYDFANFRAFDAANNYRSVSFLAVPLTDSDSRVIGVLQLVNARDVHGGVMRFCRGDLPFIEALAAQAGISLASRRLINRTETLFTEFVALINAAIDDKSPYAGAHCHRVPKLTMMLADALHTTDAGPFAGFCMSEADRYELHIAALLHDCGKISTPVHIQDKATKLETVIDRIALIELRFALACIQAADSNDYHQLRDDFAFLRRVNIGSEPMTDDDLIRVRTIGLRQVRVLDRTEPLLSFNEVENLMVRKGTLTKGEQAIINNHINTTIDMLEALPWPPHLKRVPEFAGGHHERMDGKGYPRGLTREQMSVQARMMGLADVFEALTASDRPYKKPMTLSEALHIMAGMAKNGHIDPELFEVFVRSRVYLKYAQRFLDVKQIDRVDEAALLSAPISAS